MPLQLSLPAGNVATTPSQASRLVNAPIEATHSSDFFSSLPRHSIPLYSMPASRSDTVLPLAGGTQSLVSSYAPHAASQPPISRGHMAFGVPMAGITMGTFGARGRGRGRGRVHPVTQSA
jgi:hypothetical protein